MFDAIQNNYFNTDYFCWVDFGASHIVTIPENIKLVPKSHETIRISWIARFKSDKFIFNHEALGGGVFFGHKEIMKEFIKLHNIEFEKLLNDNYCINDDKLLFLLFEKYPYLFDVFFSGYSNIMIKM